MQSKAKQLYEMLNTGSVALTVNGVVLGTVEVTEQSHRSLEVYPPIGVVSMTIQFPPEPVDPSAR